MQLRNKLSYIALGGLLMLIGMLASSVFMSSLFAQRDKFEDIECTSLTVVDNGTIQVWNGSGLVYLKDGKLGMVLGVDEHGGFVRVYDNNGKSKAAVSADEHSGRVTVNGNDKSEKVGVALDVTEHGGRVSAFGKDGRSNVGLSVNEDGGFVGVYSNDKNEKSGVALGVTEHGGRVNVFGKGKGQAVMGINEYGNGAVSTWDKNGYRQ